MTRNRRTTIVLFAAAFGVLLATAGSGAAPPDAARKSTEGGARLPAGGIESPATLQEARARARLLHETIHATLQIVHHQYFRDDEGLLIPARTMKAVFKELDRGCDVQLRWLVVDADAMNVDHKAKDEFERSAVKALASGKDEFEATDNGLYRHVGSITLSSECLGCHLPSRTSTEDRAAGLVISMRIRED
jgi:hypothetical protein